MFQTPANVGEIWLYDKKDRVDRTLPIRNVAQSKRSHLTYAGVIDHMRSPWPSEQVLNLPRARVQVVPNRLCFPSNEAQRRTCGVSR